MNKKKWNSNQSKHEKHDDISCAENIVSLNYDLPDVPELNARAFNCNGWAQQLVLVVFTVIFTFSGSHNDMIPKLELKVFL